MLIIREEKGKYLKIHIFNGKSKRNLFIDSCYRKVKPGSKLCFFGCFSTIRGYPNIKLFF